MEIVEKVGGGGGVGVLAPLSGPPPFFVQLLPTVRATEGWGGGAGRVWGAGCGSSPESTACCSLRQPATGWREGGTGEGGGARVEGVRDVGARDAGVAVGQTLRRGEGGRGEGGRKKGLIGMLIGRPRRGSFGIGIGGEWGYPVLSCVRLCSSSNRATASGAIRRLLLGSHVFSHSGNPFHSTQYSVRFLPRTRRVRFPTTLSTSHACSPESRSSGKGRGTGSGRTGNSFGSLLCHLRSLETWNTGWTREYAGGSCSS